MRLVRKRKISPQREKSSFLREQKTCNRGNEVPGRERADAENRGMLIKLAKRPEERQSGEAPAAPSGHGQGRASYYP